MMALRAGNEELAKEALARKKEHDQLAATYQDQWSKQKAAVEQLKRALRMLADKIDEAKRKKNVLIARKKRAEAQKSIQETMSGLRDQSAFETFDRMAGKIDQMEAEAEAASELAGGVHGRQARVAVLAAREDGGRRRGYARAQAEDGARSRRRRQRRRPRPRASRRPLRRRRGPPARRPRTRRSSRRRSRSSRPSTRPNSAR